MTEDPFPTLIKGQTFRGRFGGRPATLEQVLRALIAATRAGRIPWAVAGNSKSFAVEIEGAKLKLWSASSDPELAVLDVWQGPSQATWDRHPLIPRLYKAVSNFVFDSHGSLDQLMDGILKLMDDIGDSA